ncbi:hypothetical protein HMPREF0971_03348 [Segatella oris F0302]|uniref:Uncharacterized protein n=1 Tax=Segatella oris F0302 TaxID=649760 RepID=D1QWF1_9BACT|nr:hypothetical protein HMPREF0971_03348 [Segatella oris F0302]
MRIPEVRELSFHFAFSLSSCFRYFFMLLSVGSAVFVSGT